MKRINFNLQELQAFIAVAERGSFRAAADEIHLSAPALSRRIERLESALGVRLINRTTREVELNGLGRAFLERARSAFDDLEAASLSLREIGAHQSGRVTVGCVPSAAFYFLPAVIRPFSEKYPGIRLRIIDENDAIVAQSVISGEADFGIGFMGARVPELDAERLMAASRSSGNRQLIDDARAQAGLRPSIAFEVNGVATLLGMVDAGLEVAEVPGLTLPSTVHRSLTGLRLTAPAVRRQLGILKRHGAKLQPAALILHDTLRAAFRARPRPRPTSPRPITP